MLIHVLPLGFSKVDIAKTGQIRADSRVQSKRFMCGTCRLSAYELFMNKIYPEEK